MDQDFEKYIRARIRVAGEELIRRSGNLSLSGLDACAGVTVHVHIPTLSEEVYFPELKISFDCYNDQLFKTLVNEIDCSGEFAALTSLSEI